MKIPPLPLQLTEALLQTVWGEQIVIYTRNLIVTGAMALIWPCCACSNMDSAVVHVFLPQSHIFMLQRVR